MVLTTKPRATNHVSYSNTYKYFYQIKQPRKYFKHKKWNYGSLHVYLSVMQMYPNNLSLFFHAA